MAQKANVACNTPGTGRRVVIAGGGYAGTTLAVRLAKQIKPGDGIEIMLVDPDPCQESLSELDLVAVGPPRPEFCELWHPTVFKDLPVTTCYNRIHEVRADEHLVTIGPREGPHDSVEYWRLVIATGAIAFVPPVPGLKEHSVTMWSVADAQELQRRGEAQFRVAATLPTPEQRAKVLSFTVIGGGATGIEIMGTLGQRLPKRMADYGLDARDLRMRLIEGRPDILYDLPPGLRVRARRRLEELGVELHTGSMVDRVEDGAVHLANGEVIDSAVLCFCGGARPDPDATGWNLATNPQGRLVVDDNCKVQDYNDIYAVGDVAAFKDPADNRTLPMLAQYAIREAEQTADNIVRETRGKELKPFVPHMHGEFVSVGPSWGVGWAWRAHLFGIPAIIMKRLTYVMYWFTVGGTSLAWTRTREMIKMAR